MIWSKWDLSQYQKRISKHLFADVFTWVIGPLEVRSRGREMMGWVTGLDHRTCGQNSRYKFIADAYEARCGRWASIPGHWHFISHASWMILVEIQAAKNLSSWWTFSMLGYFLGGFMKWFIQPYFGAPGFWGTQWLSLAARNLHKRFVDIYMANNWLPSDQLNQLSSVQHPCWLMINATLFGIILSFNVVLTRGSPMRKLTNRVLLDFFQPWWATPAPWVAVGSNLGSTVLNIYLRQAIVQACQKKIAATC